MAEFQFDNETENGPRLVAAAEVCRPELLLPGQVELARRAFEKFLGSLALLFPGYLYLPAEIRFAGRGYRNAPSISDRSRPPRHPGTRGTSRR